MKALIVYDSVYGNTEKVVSAIAEGVASHGEVERAVSWAEEILSSDR